MITDDARVVDPKACQVEAWAKRISGGTEYWALPACNFTGNAEVTLGGAHGPTPTGVHTSDVILQVKSLFRPLERDGWGSGIVAGYQSKPAINENANLLGNFYTYLVNSFVAGSERLVVHTNLGFTHDRESQANRLLWGVGLEGQLQPRLYLIAESYGQNVGNPFYQGGVRLWIVPDRVQVDATYGNRYGGGERWISMGLRLLSPAFLP